MTVCFYPIFFWMVRKNHVMSAFMGYIRFCWCNLAHMAQKTKSVVHKPKLKNPTRSTLKELPSD